MRAVISEAIDNAHAALQAIETGRRERDPTVLKLAHGVIAQNDALQRRERMVWELRAELALVREAAPASHAAPAPAPKASKDASTILGQHDQIVRLKKHVAHLERCLAFRNVALDALGWAFTAGDGKVHQRPTAAPPRASAVAVGLTGLASMLDLLIEAGAAGLRQSELPRRMREMAGLLGEAHEPDAGPLAPGTAALAIDAICRSVRPWDQAELGAGSGVVELLAHALVLPVREMEATPERVARGLVKRFGAEQQGAVARGLLAVAFALRSAR